MIAKIQAVIEAGGIAARLLRGMATTLKYAFGVLCWIIVLNLVSMHTRLQVLQFIDGLWMQDLHDGLVRNAIGEVACRGSYGDFGQGDNYIYLVRYRPDSSGRGGEMKRLTSLVDVATFHWVRDEHVTSIYRDARHEYRVDTTSDGTDIFVDMQK